MGVVRLVVEETRTEGDRFVALYSRPASRMEPVGMVLMTV